MAYLIAIAWLLLSPLILRYYRQHRKINIRGASALLIFYSDGNRLEPVSSGTFGNLHYAAIATHPRFDSGGESSLIYVVTLPFISYVHLLGIPKKAGEIKLYPAGGSSVFEAVTLEGDYNDIFSLYTEKGMQVSSRYTLNPKEMEFTEEFCQSFSWEIVDNQLYAIRTEGHSAVDSSSLSDEVVKFVNSIQPAIARPLPGGLAGELAPYRDETRTDMKCPICQQILKNEDDYLVCPQGHGVLLRGGALLRLHAGQLNIPAKLLKSGSKDPDEMLCPACGNKMEEIAYNGKNSIIHTCTHCPYRWLSANNLVELQ